MDEFIGIIRPFAGNYAPRGWALCDGSLLQIRQYTALFAILGNQYGGDGKVTFGLPNLTGLMVAGSGTNYENGDIDGVAKNALTAANMPTHVHTVNSTVGMNCNTDGAEDGNPVGQVYSITDSAAYAPVDTTSPSVSYMSPLISSTDYTVGAAGAGASYDNRMPYLAMTYIICVEGDFPPRN